MAALLARPSIRKRREGCDAKRRREKHDDQDRDNHQQGGLDPAVSGSEVDIIRDYVEPIGAGPLLADDPTRPHSLELAPLDSAAGIERHRPVRAHGVVTEEMML